jgi:mannonate dehydratase
MRNLVQLAVDAAKQRKVVLPFRPDHGFLQAFEKQYRFYPGYSLLGRMQGLASLKGLVLGLS